MRVKAYMAAYYLAQAVYQSYMSLFYRARGLNAAGLGALYALVAAASIPGQLLFGAAAFILCFALLSLLMAYVKKRQKQQSDELDDE